ncbi:hypothetical protein GGI21_003360 [Coemansia aciculifera]|nr:hypothetical protein GGI21_003360 [Coemansia aciculifera]
MADQVIWQTGGVFKAAGLAQQQKRLLFVCIVDEGLPQQTKQLSQALDHQDVSALLSRHCICVRVAARSDDEHAFTELVPAAAQEPSISIAHSAGNTVLSGPNVVQVRVVAELKRALQLQAKTGVVHMGSLEAINNERLRRMLVSQRRGNDKRVKQAVSAFRDDRRGIDYMHGVRKGVRLMMRASNGKSLVVEFAADTGFAQVREFAEKELGALEIALAGPPVRRVLVKEEDDAKSLTELGLSPSATLLVRVPDVPEKGVKVLKEPWVTRRQLACLLAAIVLVIAALLPK